MADAKAVLDAQAILERILKEEGLTHNDLRLLCAQHVRSCTRAVVDAYGDALVASDALRDDPEGLLGLDGVPDNDNLFGFEDDAAWQRFAILADIEQGMVREHWERSSRVLAETLSKKIRTWLSRSIQLALDGGGDGGGEGAGQEGGQQEQQQQREDRSKEKEGGSSTERTMTDEDIEDDAGDGGMRSAHTHTHTHTHRPTHRPTHTNKQTRTAC